MSTLPKLKVVDNQPDELLIAESSEPGADDEWVRFDYDAIKRRVWIDSKDQPGLSLQRVDDLIEWLRSARDRMARRG